MRGLLRKFGCLILLVACFPLFSIAQPMVDKLPGDALIYIGWSGVDTMGPGFAGSRFKAVWDATDMSSVVEEFIPAIIDRVAQESPEVRQFAPIAWPIIRAMAKHPSAIYIGNVLEGPQAKPEPRIILACEAGKDSKQLVDLLTALTQGAKGAPFPVEVKEEGGVVMLRVGRFAAGTLAADAKFKAAMARTVKTPSVAMYVDMESLVKQADSLIVQMAPPEVQGNWPKIRDGIGLSGIRRVAVAGGFDSRDWVEAVFVDAPAPRKGIFAGTAGAAYPDDMLKFVPRSAASMTATRFSLDGLVGGIENAVVSIEPRAGAEIEKFKQDLNKALGFDVRKDMLGSLGDEWLAYADPGTGGFGPVGSVLINRLKDPAKAEATFTKFEQAVTQMIAKETSKEKISIAFKTRKIGTTTLHYLAIPMVTPTWTIVNGKLIVALYPEPVITAAGFVSKGGPSILENEGFQAVRTRLAVKTASSIQFADLPKLAPVNYGSWMMISRVVGIADIFGINSPLIVLAPMDVVMANLTPMGTASWDDENGFYMRSVSPFPGAEILSVDPVGAYMTSAGPLAISILLPSLSKARESANRVKAAANLRQIGMACLLHSNENKNKLPDNLGELLKQDLTPNVFFSPSGNFDASILAGKTPEQLAAIINEKSDYVYVAKGRTATMTADEVVAYEKLEVHHFAGGNVLFGDFHVEWLLPADYTRLKLADR